MLTCYDLRFPEVSLMLRKRGADIITYPSAFTMRTGAAHWGAYSPFLESI
jgi:predicted amidohydrolase